MGGESNVLQTTTHAHQIHETPNDHPTNTHKNHNLVTQMPEINPHNTPPKATHEGHEQTQAGHAQNKNAKRGMISGR